MIFDWNQMPHILRERRTAAVEQLILAKTWDETVTLRAQIQLLGELMKLPDATAEEREFQESIRSTDDDD